MIDADADVARGSREESELIRELFDRPGYNTLVRPVRNLSEPLVIQVEITFQQLIHLVCRL